MHRRRRGPRVMQADLPDEKVIRPDKAPRGLPFRCTLIAGMACWLSIAHAAEPARMYASVANKGFQIGMAREFARHVGRPADVSLYIQGIAGTPEAFVRGREQPGLTLAFVQSDAARAYQLAESRGRDEARDLIGPWRVVAPLHAEDIYFVVRRDSPLQSLEDLATARINLGPLHSGSSLTVATVYRLLFDAAIPDAQAKFLPTEDALVKLLTDQSLDAVAIVAPRPSRFLADMKPEAKQFIRLLRFDPSSPKASVLSPTYTTTNVAMATYPNVLDGDLPALSVRIYLAASSIDERSDAALGRLAGSWCKNLPKLAADGPPQWRELQVSLPELLPGWRYARSAQRELRACIDGTTPERDECTDENRTLGLCR